MGLWGSKPARELTVQNPDKPTEVYVTEKALTNVIKSSTGEEKQNKPVQTNNNVKSESKAELPPDLREKRISEYEANMLNRFNQTTKEVEKLFGERYETVPICLDLQASISNCYTENPKHPLKCVNIANEYVKCVETERQRRMGLPGKFQSA